MLLHTNIQCIRHKTKRIEALIYNAEPAIISVTEHWLKKEEIEATCIQGYVVADAFCRDKHRNGGTMIFTKTGLTSTPLNDITALSVEKHFEVSAATVEGLDIKTAIVVLYRSPLGDLKIFMENLTTVLLRISRLKHRVVVAADFNVNFMETGPQQQALMDLFSSFNLHMAINKPTRITRHSSTCIDNIFTNIDKDLETATITDAGISDHCTLALRVRLPTTREAKNTNDMRRTFTKKQRDTFAYKLSRTNWDPVLLETSVDGKFDAFMKIFTALFEESFPKRKMKRSTTNKNPTNEWYTPELQSLSAEVWKAYQESKHTADEARKRRYLAMKRHYITSLDTAKINHNNKAIKKSTNKQKTAWGIIRSNQNSHKGEGKQEIHISNDNNIIITLQTEVANLFNNFFRDQVENLIRTRTEGKRNNEKKIYSRKTDKVIFLSPLTPREYYEIMKKVKKKKSSGSDEVPGTLMQDIDSFVMEPLLDIANATFIQGSFPQKLKHALTIPMLKKGDRTKLENYRQISLLSIFSKFLEIAFCSRLVSFLEKNSLLNPRQHGFTKKRSTMTAITEFICEVHEAMDKKNNAVGIFYDYSKAFDTINHRILLEKLEAMGIAGNANTWIKTYLQDRTQTVALRGPNGTTLSEKTTTNVGLPQGSTISPILFTLFTADLTTHANVGSLTLYADDTTQLITDAPSNNPEEEQTCLSQRGSKAVQQMQDYCIDDGLFLNRKKTVMLHFKPPRHIHDFSPLIRMDNKSIPVQEEVSFLGVKLENTLEWKSHTDTLCKKIASDCHLLRKIKEVTSPEVVKMLYFSQIEAKLRYGITLWGNSNHARRVLILQKRCVRTMAGANSNPCTAGVYVKDSCKPLFRKFQILTLPCLYIFCNIIYIKENPELLTTNGNYHSHDTRRRNDPCLQKHNMEAFKNNPTYAGAKLFNALPRSIKAKEGSAFKSGLKQYLLEKCYYDVKEFYKFDNGYVL